MREDTGCPHSDTAKKPLRVMLIVTLLSAIATATIAVVMAGFSRAAVKSEPEGMIYDRYYVMITDDGKSSIWSSVYDGALERGMEDNVYVDWLTASLGERYDRTEQMEIAIASGVDGIIVTADESDEMTSLIDEASEKGIPVITLYGDNTKSRRCSFVGIGSYNLGREYGRLALEIASDRARDDAESFDVAVLINSNTQSLDQNILCSGIQESLESWEGEEPIELSLIPIDNTNAFSVEESIRDIFMGADVPDVIICLDELCTTCVYQALVDRNRVGSVSVLAYYDSDIILKAIDRKVIYATVSIDTKQMGSYCIDALQEYNEQGYTSQYFTTDIAIINKDNISEYMAQRDEADE